MKIRIKYWKNNNKIIYKKLKNINIIYYLLIKNFNKKQIICKIIYKIKRKNLINNNKNWKHKQKNYSKIKLKIQQKLLKIKTNQLNRYNKMINKQL